MNLDRKSLIEAMFSVMEVKIGKKYFFLMNILEQLN
mgnify:CR=1 FL=1